MRRELPELKSRLPLLGAVVIALLVGALAFALTRDDPRPAPGSSGSGEAATEPELPQAAWTIKTFAAGTAGAPKRSHRKLVAAERDALTAAVTRVADALVLEPASLGELTGEHLSKAAARALRDSGLVVPDGLTDVRATKREASIGLDSNGGVRAAAQIELVVRATSQGRPVRFVESANLFLRKTDGRWQVVAFDGRLRPRRTAGAPS